MTSIATIRNTSHYLLNNVNVVHDQNIIFNSNQSNLNQDQDQTSFAIIDPIKTIQNLSTKTPSSTINNSSSSSLFSQLKHCR
jgi:hypothetical protein